MEKICIKCGLSKSLESYYTSKSHKDGLMGTCKQCFNLLTKQNSLKSYHRNPEVARNRNAKWATDNKDYNKKWRKANAEHVRSYAKSYQKTPLQRLKANIRARIAQELSGYSKSKTTLEILQVESFDALKVYIESLFVEGMSWDNYGLGEGKWVIDHKKPLVLAETEEDVLKLNHYTNLQPMWWRDNMNKGIKVV